MSIKSILPLLLALCAMFISCSDEDGGGIDNGGSIDEMEQIDDPNDGDNELKTAPSFSLDTYDGMKISSADFEGKAVAIFFFGYSCPPCMAIGPEVESKLHEKYKDDPNFIMVGIDTWDGNSSAVENFKKSTGVTFPLGIKGSGVANTFSQSKDRLVVINKEGKIAFSGTRNVDSDLDDAVDLVKKLLAE